MWFAVNEAFLIEPLLSGMVTEDEGETTGKRFKL
jgi:hypothetical protein